MALLSIGWASGAAGQLVRPGVSESLARERAATISDLSYDLHFRIPADPDSAVTGTATLRYDRAGDGPVILDFDRPERIGAVRVAGRPVEFQRAATHVVVPGTAVPTGPVAITLAFVADDAPLNRRGDFLYTLFVPDRAHEAFPAFDQPDLKARFRLRLDVPAGWEAVGNGPVERQDTVNDRVVYRFGPTEPLPTYLFAFAAGDFQVEEARRNGRTLRLFHRETDSTKVARNRDALFDLHATALEWMEAYTGIPYPFAKFDFVAIPSFQYNGMEHPGAILYRAYETSHMWFGNLVTMRWFNDVWMKEVFANFMAAKIVNPSFPDLDHDLRFLLAHYPAAYGVDRTPGANPIRQPLDNLAQAGALYGAIIYQKAPIVMRQLEQLTGEAPFREALRRYLDAHRFGNAGWPALVRELDAVTDLDVSAWSRVWIEEAGRPTIRVERAADTVRLQPADPAQRGRVWPQRTRVGVLHDGAGSDGGAIADPGHEQTVTIAGEPVAVPMGQRGSAGSGEHRGVVLPNVDGLGYGLFVLDSVSTAVLLDALPAVSDPLARAAAWLDLREMMLDGAVPPARLLDLGIRMAAVEADELVAQQVLEDTEELYWRFVPDSVRIAQSIRAEEMLWDRVAEVEGASMKAAYFNTWRALATSPRHVTRMRAVWSGELEVPGLPLSEQDHTTLALHLALRGVPGADSILDAQEERIANPDRRDRFRFIRRAASPDPGVRERFFASLADRQNRAREEWVVTALSLLHHPLRAEASLPYIRPALDRLLEVQRTGDIFFPTRWLAATLGGHASPEAATTVRAFIDAHPDYPPRLLGKLLQEADPLFRAVRLRSAATR
ncbi:MAG: M1 family aminopeptidase [Gemmatimonadota bacterium]